MEREREKREKRERCQAERAKEGGRDGFRDDTDTTYKF
jgi:hypothetical protein